MGEHITVVAEVAAPLAKVWECWGQPEHIMNWNAASPDWHCPKAENDLQTGGKFSSTMAAKDGSFSFDFAGVYDKVEEHKEIAYTMEDGRTVTILFEEKDGKVTVTETFEAEGTNPIEMQRGGWQAILDNFKNYTEAQ